MPTASLPDFSTPTYGINVEDNVSYQETLWRDPRATSHSSNYTGMNTDEMHSLRNYASQDPSINPNSESYSDPSWHSDFNLLPAFQNAVTFPDAQTSGVFDLPENPANILQPTPIVSHEDEVTVASFDPVQFGDDDLPFCSSSYVQEIAVPEPMSTIFDFFETDPSTFYHLSHTAYGSLVY